ncbi:MAG: hypothetical protein MJ153_07335 [Clostridia bacterium]|nr:hypothetical protein [Clostridia bacterium]
MDQKIGLLLKELRKKGIIQEQLAVSLLPSWFLPL